LLTNLAYGLDEVFGHSCSEDVHAGHDTMDGVDQPTGRGFLQHDASGAELDGLEEIRRIDRGGKHNDSNLLERNRRECFQSPHSRHGDIEQQYVWNDIAHDSGGVEPVDALRHDLEARLALEQPAEALPEDR
jgi:hypothetical protein